MPANGAPRSDKEIIVILTDALHELLSHNESIHLRVESGNVHVSGWVRSPEVKSLIEDTAAGVPGVLKVYNRIEIGR